MKQFTVLDDSNPNIQNSNTIHNNQSSQSPSTTITLYIERKGMKQKPTLNTRKKEYRIARDLESYRIPRNSQKETTDIRRMKSLLRKVMVLFLITTYQFFCLGKLDNLWVYGYLNAGKTTHTLKEIYGGIWKLRVGRQTD